ncbi:MAG TPA: HEAT repeat domain-containing protein, partial [Gemmataceae bacterium]|nr:HEAT repeat domain-containing protein [Gemmataceae bacterium]
YTCPAVSADEKDRLSTSLKANAGTSENMPAKKDRKREPREISPEIKKRIAQIDNHPAKNRNFVVSDNSNTQFALLGLWVGSRYSLPVEAALARVEGRFRKTQNSDGGWGYRAFSSEQRWNPSASAPAMTCAGLLGLAVGQGARVSLKTQPSNKTKEIDPKDKNRDDPTRDKAVNNGLRYLAGAIGKPIGRDLEPRGFGPGHRVGGSSYYLLWSIERVAVAYGLETIGNKDWYAWASDVLLAAQKPNGTWEGTYGAGVDTSFALLVLRKANLASDLTVALKGKVKDPSQTSLKSETAAQDKPKTINEESETDTSAKANPVEPKPNAVKPAEGLAKRVEPKPIEPKPIEPKPIETPDAEAMGLARDLLRGSGDKKENALEAFRKGRGSAYTRELASAIGSLEGEDKKKARQVLAERLSFMTAATLGEKLKDESAEIRRAAALACAMKEETVHVPRLIEMIDDADINARRAAVASLKSLTGQDFGPQKNASPEEILTSMKAWQAWWKKQNDK